MDIWRVPIVVVMVYIVYIVWYGMVWMVWDGKVWFCMSDMSCIYIEIYDILYRERYIYIGGGIPCRYEEIYGV